MKYDLVIKNGNIISFSPDKINKGNIGIKNGKIDTISSSPIDGDTTIDAEGKYVSPGFIDFHSHVNGRVFSAMCLLRQGVTTTIGGERYFDAKIIRDIETEGFIINHGFYISYSFTLRRAVGLHDPSKQATPDEVDNMIRLAERFFHFGVKGIHIGLEYAPGTSEDELLNLLKISKKYDKIAMIHLRTAGRRAIEALDEIIRVTDATGATVNILHVMYTAGMPGILDEFLQRIEDARKNGCDITADTGLYGGFPAYAGSLSLHSNWNMDYDERLSEKDLVISSGVRVGQFCTPESFQYIRREFPTTLITAFVFDEGQIENAIKPDYMMISTDGAYGPHHDNIGHPESSGTFPKLIGEFVREKKTLNLIDAIKKITFLPANRIKIKNKGNIKEGMDADLTIFDLENINSNSDYVSRGNPNAEPDGIDYVIVNGIPVLHKNKCLTSNKFAGKMIK